MILPIQKILLLLLKKIFRSTSFKLHQREMRLSILTLGIVGSALALPHPQDIDLDAVAAAEPPVIVTPPYDVASNIPSVLTTTSVAPIATDGPESRKRSDTAVEKRDGTCAAQPAGHGPVPSPDTAAAFQSDPDLQVGIHIPR